MKKPATGTILISAMLMFLLLTSCVQPASSPTASTPLPSPASSPSPHALATPYASEPAAGICASFEGEVVTVKINIDTSDPRCTRVRADQELTVVNQTLTALQVSLGSFNTSLLPGADYSITVPFGDYLAPGVHQLQVSPCCSAELWLEGNP